ncbi:hypothetical protein EJD88_23455 [Pseudomonas sp. PB105]|nr:hypothetical protein EJD88_23455 [Pseudomonas sp. PB105]MVW94820.1 hypothetical protein [Pseudomonas sp. PB100]
MKAATSSSIRGPWSGRKISDEWGDGPQQRHEVAPRTIEPFGAGRLLAGKCGLVCLVLKL